MEKTKSSRRESRSSLPLLFLCGPPSLKGVIIPKHSLSPLSHQLLQPGWLYAYLGKVFNRRPLANPIRSSIVLLHGPHLDLCPYSAWQLCSCCRHIRARITSIRPQTSNVLCDIKEPLCSPCQVHREVRAQQDTDWQKLKGISCFHKGTFVRNVSWVSLLLRSLKSSNDVSCRSQEQLYSLFSFSAKVANTCLEE